MKKIFYVAATALGLSIIFGAGWAAGTGVQEGKVSPINVIQPNDDDFEVAPKNEEDCQNKGNGFDMRNKKFGFRFIIPSPRFSNKLPH